jgi:CPA2 family monovalent cation:H+ antiporter-2
MHDHGLIADVVMILCSAVVLSTSLRYLKMPPILVYLITGLIIGPTGVALVDDQESVQLLAEFGVVFLLFSLGLEFSLPRLLSVKRIVFGLGSLQVATCGLLFFSIVYFYGVDATGGSLCAIILALSSTAIVSKELTQMRQLHSRIGQLSIGILLFQDIVAVLALSLVPLLANTGGTSGSTLFFTLFKTAGFLFAAMLLGRWTLPALFTEIAKARSEELFILTALTVAVASAYFTQAVGLSMSLGAFVAGMLLGESNFKHQIEADIRPFRDVLLGVFFVSIGMLMDLQILMQYWHRILFFTLGLILFKAVVIGLGIVCFKEPRKEALQTGIILAQGGEFGFVLLALGQTHNLLQHDVASFALAIVILSMMISTLMIRHSHALMAFLDSIWPNLIQATQKEPSSQTDNKAPQVLTEHPPEVLILGYGRVGQAIGRFLAAEGICYIAIDDDPLRVSEAVTAGEAVLYGDANQYKLLRQAQIDSVKLVVISFDNDDLALEILHQIRTHHRDLRILVRSRDNARMSALLAAGASEVIPEVLEASLMLISQVLLASDIAPGRVQQILASTRQAHYQQLHAFYGGEEANTAPIKQSGFTEYLHPIVVEEHHALIGQSIEQVQRTLDNACTDNVKIEGIKEANNPQPITPSPQRKLTAGDIIILRGARNPLEQAQLILTVNS